VTIDRMDGSGEGLDLSTPAGFKVDAVAADAFWPPPTAEERPLSRLERLLRAVHAPDWLIDLADRVGLTPREVTRAVIADEESGDAGRPPDGEPS